MDGATMVASKISLESGLVCDSIGQVSGELSPWRPQLGIIAPALFLGRIRLGGGASLWEIALDYPLLFAKALSIPQIRGHLDKPFCDIRTALAPYGYELAEVGPWCWVIRRSFG